MDTVIRVLELALTYDLLIADETARLGDTTDSGARASLGDVYSPAERVGVNRKERCSRADELVVARPQRSDLLIVVCPRVNPEAVQRSQLRLLQTRRNEPYCQASHLRSL